MSNVDGRRPSRPLSIRDAAARVRRSRSTVELWIAEGHLSVTAVKDVQGRVVRRYVDEEELLSVLRSKILANPSRPKHPKPSPTTHEH